MFNFELSADRDGFSRYFIHFHAKRDAAGNQIDKVETRKRKPLLSRSTNDHCTLHEGGNLSSCALRSRRIWQRGARERVCNKEIELNGMIRALQLLFSAFSKRHDNGEDREPDHVPRAERHRERKIGHKQGDLNQSKDSRNGHASARHPPATQRTLRFDPEKAVYEHQQNHAYTHPRAPHRDVAPEEVLPPRVRRIREGSPQERDHEHALVKPEHIHASEERHGRHEEEREENGVLPKTLNRRDDVRRSVEEEHASRMPQTLENDAGAQTGNEEEDERLEPPELHHRPRLRCRVRAFFCCRVRVLFCCWRQVKHASGSHSPLLLAAPVIHDPFQGVRRGLQVASVPQPLQLHSALQFRVREDRGDRLTVERESKARPLHLLRREHLHAHRRRLPHVLKPLLARRLRVVLGTLHVRTRRERNGRTEEEKEGLEGVVETAVREGEPVVAENEHAIAT